MEIVDTAQFIRVFSLAAISFVVAVLWTPILANFLYRFKLAQKIRQESWDGHQAELYRKLHSHKEGTPTMGGLLIWVTTGLLTLFFNLSRSQTWLPLFVLVTSGILGLVDDWLNVNAVSFIKGLSTKIKFISQFLIAGLGSWWFFYKLEFSEISIPAASILGLPEQIDIGWLYIPLFILTVVFITNAVNITDGLDGLAGGTLAVSFAAILALALIQRQLGIAAFAGTIVGALLAFLWFNIHPARFYMGDTGAFALGATLAVLAFLTNTVLLLPFVAFVFVVEGFSSLLQRFWKKVFKRKLFLIAPLHHHFEAIGWPETKVTMRFWVIAAVMAIIGTMIGLI